MIIKQTANKPNTAILTGGNGTSRQVRIAAMIQQTATSTFTPLFIIRWWRRGLSAKIARSRLIAARCNTELEPEKGAIILKTRTSSVWHRCENVNIPIHAANNGCEPAVTSKSATAKLKRRKLDDFCRSWCVYNTANMISRLPMVPTKARRTLIAKNGAPGTNSIVHSLLFSWFEAFMISILPVFYSVGLIVYNPISVLCKIHSNRPMQICSLVLRSADQASESDVGHNIALSFCNSTIQNISLFKLLLLNWCHINSGKIFLMIPLMFAIEWKMNKKVLKIVCRYFQHIYIGVVDPSCHF